ncbi:copper amine oxidase N-terminal domain-containing protein [Pelotomaculum propionicicum]|uniref:copper amine oxidase N-terminal domain-containing protein n=1 Tax=Pelotomaculum propionicicum TaxID=258475 RepID=UPI003B78240D
MVETNPATDVAPGSVSLNGNVIDSGGKIDEYGFIYWGAGTAQQQTVTVARATHTGFFNKTINYLEPGTYYYKAYAQNTKGLAEGEVHSFTIADRAINVILDGKTMEFEVLPFLDQGRTMVPLRAIFEALGAGVQWDGESRTVTAVKDSREIKLVIDGAAYINGAVVNLDVPAKIINERTVVPLRFVSEALGCTVTWDENNKTVTITR